MTDHYFEHPLVTIHYYKFGVGKQTMLCFHGYGMHGKQFKVLEETLGEKYTFYGFDLFFHKQTKLVNHTLEEVKKGLSKKELAEIIKAFCKHEFIDRFSVIGYSMGSHYATAIVEQLSKHINEYIVVAPSSVKPGTIINFFSTNLRGNKILEKLVLSEKGLVRLLHVCKRLKIIDTCGHQILFKEIETPELRFSFYACLTYLRFLITNETHLINALNEQNIKSYFVFGRRDSMYPPRIFNRLRPKLNLAEIIILDENHEMINKNFAVKLSQALK